jgi:5'-nucleotidase
VVAVRILVTNDDGIESPGLRALAAALAADGHDILVVAPTEDRSGSGAGLGGLHRDGTLELVTHEWPDVPGASVHAVGAPPAMAVLAACHGAFGMVPDLVASGINPGPNTGDLVIHSGTVGAILTAAAAGIPGIAVSIGITRDPFHWDTAAAVATAAVEWVAKPDDEPRLLNINVPNVSMGELRGVREAGLARMGQVWVSTADHQRGALKLDYQRPGRDLDPDTDLALVRECYAAVTPLATISRSRAGGAADAIAVGLTTQARSNR